EREREDDLDRQSQASTYHERPRIDKPRITLSTFTGSDPDAWLNRAVQYFELNETDGPDRVRYAAYYLDGEANVWWQWLTRIYRKRQQIITWDVFERELLTRFGTSDFHNYNEALTRIRQTSSLREYIREFERLACRVRDWPEKALVGAFIDGLKFDLAAEVRLERPDTMHDAMEVARRREDHLFTPGHQCKQAFVIEVANPDDKEVEVEEEPPQDDEIKVFSDEPEISMHAMVGIRGPRTMRLPAWVKDRKVMVLVDNGSSHNFINAKLSQKLNLPTLNIEPFEVRVANGERLQCTKSFRKVPIRFSGVTVKADLYALPLVGPDVVLGVQWLEGLGKVTTDYRTGIMEFNSDGRQVTFSTSPEKEAKEVGLKSIEKVWRGGGLIFAVVVEDVGAHSSKDAQQQGDVRELLEELEGVLGEPKGLPPHR
ncbi:Unknown protein, partial [Striga hermonthica]